MRPGTLIADRFEVGERAGAGGVGLVYRALDRTTGDPVAIKILIDHARDAERFAREAKTLARLTHPGIVRHVAHGACPHGPFIAMEWLHGHTAADRFRAGRMPVVDALLLLQRVVEALGHAHGKGVVHRDLKPANLFLVDDAPANAKILDFGLAALVGTAAGLTRTGVPLGTPAYMAPEQVRGASESDERADIYSLGCILYEALTGCCPFPGHNPASVLEAVLTTTPPSAGSVRPELAPAVDALVVEMMSRRRSARPATTQAVLERIRGLLPASARGRVTPARSGVPPAPESGHEGPISVLVCGPPSAEEASWDLLCDTYGAVEICSTPTARALLFAEGSGEHSPAVRAARCALAHRSLSGARDAAVVTRPGNSLDQSAPAAWAEQAATLSAGAPNALLIDKSTRVALPPTFKTQPAEHGFELRAERAEPQRQGTIDGSVFVGRDRELKTMGLVLEGCRAERRPAAVLVTGPAGTGKRSLVLTALAGLGQEAEVWTGEADPLAQRRCGLMAGALRSLLGPAVEESPGSQYVRLRARLGGLQPAPAEARAAVFLTELLSGGLPGDPPPALRAARHDPQLMGDQIRRACREMVRSRCREWPLVLVMHDLQWADPASVDIIDGLLRVQETNPLLVIATATPEVHEVFPNLWNGRAVRTIRMGALGKRGCNQLVRTTLGESPPPDHWSAGPVRVSGGNPFFLRELLRAERERGTAPIPSSAEAYLAERFRDLPGEHRRVLRAASVYGHVSWQAAVEAVMSEPPGGAGPVITALMRDGWLVPSEDGRLARDDGVRFRHHLLWAAAYDSLSPRHAVLGHRLAGRWLEAAGEREAIALAAHYDRGHDEERAITWFVRAARDALADADPATAVARATQALEKTAGGDAETQELYATKVAGLAMLQRWTELREVAGRALALLPTGSPLWCRVHSSRAEALLACGAHGELRRAAEQLLLLDDGAPQRDAVHALLYEAWTLIEAGEATLAARLAERLPNRNASIWADPWLDAKRHSLAAARAAAAQDHETTTFHEHAAAQRFAEIGDERRRLACGIREAVAQVKRGDIAQATELLRMVERSATELDLGELIERVRTAESILERQ